MNTYLRILSFTEMNSFHIIRKKNVDIITVILFLYVNFSYICILHAIVHLCQFMRYVELTETFRLAINSTYRTRVCLLNLLRPLPSRPFPVGTNYVKSRHVLIYVLPNLEIRSRWKSFLFFPSESLCQSAPVERLLSR